MRKFAHINATTIDEAVNALKKGDAMVIAGGTDLLGTLRFEVLRTEQYPKTLVNIKTIVPSLDYIKEEGGMLKIGAVTRLEDIAKSAIVQQKWTALAEAAHNTASPHIRESGTIGGNICQLNRCWYFRKRDNRFDCIRKGGNMCFAMAGDNRFHSIFGAVQACIAVNPSDIAPALVALNAKIVTNKQTIDIENFWKVVVPGSTALADDEIVKEIQIPALAAGVKSAFVKFALRASIDFPVVNCAAAVGGGNARICLNAVHNNPYRVTKAEDSIKGKAIDETTAAAAATAGVTGNLVMPAAGSNPGNKWKVQLANAMIKRAILACK
jgi:xanthine dehydrogenase YagS FAD-binding subunit